MDLEDLEKLPELALVGTLLKDCDEIISVMEHVEPSHFKDEPLGKIYSHLVAEHAGGVPVDIVMLIADQLDEYLSHRALQALNSSHCKENVLLYAKQVRKASDRRRTSQAFETTQLKLADGVDPYTVISELQEQIGVIAQLADDRLGFVGLEEGNAMFIDQLNDQLSGDPEKMEARLNTGIPMLDAELRGIRPGELTIVGGLPASGKTTMAVNIIAETILKAKKDVLFFSYEMGNSKIYRTLHALLGHHSNEGLDGNPAKFDPEKLAKSNEMLMGEGVGMFIYTKKGKELVDLKQFARIFKERYPNMGLLVVDYLQKIRNEEESKYSQVTLSAEELRNLAEELGIAVVSLAQCKAVSPPRLPELRDLKDSGGIGAEADKVLLIHDPDNGCDERIVIIAKNRDYRDGVKGKLLFHGEFAEFKEITGQCEFIPAHTKTKEKEI